MAVGAGSGAIIGAILTGPFFLLGAAAGGAVGGYTTIKISKAGKRRKEQREKNNL